MKCLSTSFYRSTQREDEVYDPSLVSNAWFDGESSMRRCNSATPALSLHTHSATATDSTLNTDYNLDRKEPFYVIILAKGAAQGFPGSGSRVVAVGTALSGRPPHRSGRAG